MKRFNITGTCIPGRHYMVDTSSKLNQIIELIDQEEYFTINRSRQYGKSTILSDVKRILRDGIQVISISFKNIGDESVSTDKEFVDMLVSKIGNAMKFTDISTEDKELWVSDREYDKVTAVKYLSKKITELCEKYEVVLIVDDADKCPKTQRFLNFLGMLREKYLSRNAGKDFTFKSVILAGVYDVKNLKLKLRPDEERKYNSPWNIAVDFNVDMSFHPEEIATMLEDYEKDYHTGMDIKAVSEELYHYTGGYPYLVSWLCKWIEEKGNREWTSQCIQRAIKHYYCADSTLKDDLIKNYENNPVLREMIDSMIISGREYSFVSTDEAVSLGLTFGIFKRSENSDVKLEISNIIFANILTEHVLFKKERERTWIPPEKNQFIKEDGHLDIVHVLDRFQAFMKSEYREEDERFIESQGRLLFLCFLKPIINGTGFYYVEPETRTNSRMDIVVTYLDEEFIIELKIWRGDQYRKDGIKQLNGYLESREQSRGYLVSFSFLKNREYKSGYLKDIKNDDVPGIESREIYEVTV